MNRRIRSDLRDAFETLPEEISETDRLAIKDVWKSEVNWMLTESETRHLRYQIDVSRLAGGVTLKAIHDLLSETRQIRLARLPRPVRDSVEELENSDTEVGVADEAASSENVEEGVAVTITDKPKAIEFEPQDRGVPHIPRPISYWSSPEKARLARAGLKAGVYSVLENLVTNSDALKIGFGVAAVKAMHSFTVAKDPKPFAITDGLAQGLVAGGTTVARDFLAGAGAVYRRILGHNFEAELLKPDSEAAQARINLGRRYGANWVRTFERWARDPKSVASLEQIAGIASVAVNLEHAVEHYPPTKAEERLIESAGLFNGFRLSDNESAAASAFTIVDDFKATDEMKKLYSLCKSEPYPKSIEGAEPFWSIANGVLNSKSPNVLYYASLPLFKSKRKPLPTDKTRNRRQDPQPAQVIPAVVEQSPLIHRVLSQGNLEA